MLVRVILASGPALKTVVFEGSVLKGEGDRPDIVMHGGGLWVPAADQAGDGAKVPFLYRSATVFPAIETPAA